MHRRDRTRQLIELGGLVAKAGLVELTGDDRAMIYGALLQMVDAAASSDRDTIRELWRRRGRRAFDQEAAAALARAANPTEPR